MFKRTLLLAGVLALSTVAFAQSAAQSGAQSATSAAKPATVAKSKTLTALQGAWVFTTANGQDLTGQPDIVVTVTDDKYVQTVAGNVVEKGVIKIDDTKKPMQMDVTIVEGDGAGKVQLGIFEFQGTGTDAVRLKLNTAGNSTRPTDFVLGEGFSVITAVRKK